MLSALAHRMLGDDMHSWITFVFMSNTFVSLDITKTSPHDHATLFPAAFHALRLRFTICILVYCTIARMSSFSGQCERLSRRLVINGLLIKYSHPLCCIQQKPLRHAQFQKCYWIRYNYKWNINSKIKRFAILNT